MCQAKAMLRGQKHRWEHLASGNDRHPLRCAHYITHCIQVHGYIRNQMVFSSPRKSSHQWKHLDSSSRSIKRINTCQTEVNLFPDAFSFWNKSKDMGHKKLLAFPFLLRNPSQDSNSLEVSKNKAFSYNQISLVFLSVTEGPHTACSQQTRF